MKTLFAALALCFAGTFLLLPASADQINSEEEGNSLIESVRDDFQTGISSWYGPGFHGNQTANGEIFDQTKLTAAHRTLPLPSLIRVTNLETQKSLVLRVNDRGPYIDGRVLDVSHEAAKVLGFEKKGLAEVMIEVLGDPKKLDQQAAK